MSICVKAFSIAMFLFVSMECRAAESPTEESLRKLNIHTLKLVTELNKLAEASPAAKKFLNKPVETGTLKFFGEISYYALEDCDWSLKRCKLEYPFLCEYGQVVACVRADDAQHYVIYTADGMGPYAATVSAKEGFVWFTCADSVALDDTAGYYDYEVISDIRGDILVARFEPRFVMGNTTRSVYIEHLYIHNKQIERLKHVVEEYPIPSR